MLKKIISGGQTGADRAALDFAIKMGIPQGGWVPKGRLAEDGPISDSYNLKELPTRNYSKLPDGSAASQNDIFLLATSLIPHIFIIGHKRRAHCLIVTLKLAYSVIAAIPLYHFVVIHNLKALH